MSSPFLAEIRMFGFNYNPRGWAFCNGQLLAFSQNTALFSLLGTTYGGDGRTTFALPNLQGSFPVTSGQGAGFSQYVLGQVGGTTAVTLLSTQLPAHTHTMNAQNANGNSVSPVGNMTAQFGLRTAGENYGSDATTTPLTAGAVSVTGGSQPHNNLPPYLAVNYCIAMQGIFPQRP